MEQILEFNFYHITVNVYYSEHGGNESSFNLIWKQKYKVEPYQGLMYHDYNTNITTDNLGCTSQLSSGRGGIILPVAVVLFTPTLTEDLKNLIIEEIELNYDKRNGAGRLRKLKIKNL